jgi:hypothetical protein
MSKTSCGVRCRSKRKPKKMAGKVEFGLPAKCTVYRPRQPCFALKFSGLAGKFFETAITANTAAGDRNW